MKICFVISTVNILSGANQSLLDLISSIKKAGHECIVIAPSHGNVEKVLVEQGIEYKVIPFMNSIKANHEIKTIIKKVYNWLGMIKLRSFLLKNRIQILHNNSLPTTVGMEAAHSARIPYICHIWENIWDGLGMEFYNFGKVKKLIKDSSSVIVISNYLMRSYKLFEPFGNYSTVFDGINVEHYYEKKRFLRMLA